MPNGTISTVVGMGRGFAGDEGPAISACGREMFLAGSRSVVLANPADPFSLVSQTDTLSINGHPFVTSYNAAQRRFTLATPRQRQAFTRIDAQGRVIEEEVPGFHPVTYTYDLKGRLIKRKQDTRIWRYCYDNRGRLAAVTDPLGSSDSLFYNLADELVRQVLPDGRSIRYDYDASGNLIGLTPPGRPEHDFSYTAVNLARSYTPPVAGGDSSITSYTYDLDRQLTKVTRPDGTLVRLNYDLAGRLSTVTWPGGSRSYGYDAVTGDLASVGSADGTTLRYSYDGLLTTGQVWTGPVAGSVGFGYRKGWS